MTEDYANESKSYSSFWPLLILMVGLVSWIGYQAYMANAQRSYCVAQLEAAKPTLDAAKSWQLRYGTLLDDLRQTASKDPAIVPLANAAIQAGIQTGLLHRTAPTDTNAPSAEQGK